MSLPFLPSVFVVLVRSLSARWTCNPSSRFFPRSKVSTPFITSTNVLVSLFRCVPTFNTTFCLQLQFGAFCAEISEDRTPSRLERKLLVTVADMTMRAWMYIVWRGWDNADKSNIRCIFGDGCDGKCAKSAIWFVTDFQTKRNVFDVSMIDAV